MACSLRESRFLLLGIPDRLWVPGTGFYRLVCWVFNVPQSPPQVSSGMKLCYFPGFTPCFSADSLRQDWGCTGPKIPERLLIKEKIDTFILVKI